MPDVIETDGTQQLGAQTARPVWCTIEVPDHAEPGIYKTKLEVVDSASNKVITRLNLKVNVSKHTLPSPAEQQFHVDFWQQPYAVSRYYGLERWSEAHCEALKPYLRLLARSGQKVVSAILFYEPWGDQSVDKFDPMIQTTKKRMVRGLTITRCSTNGWNYARNVAFQNRLTVFDGALGYVVPLLRRG